MDKKENKKKEDQAKSIWRQQLEKRKKLVRQKEQERLNKDQGHSGSRSINRKQFTRNRRSTQGGGSTLEILVAFVVITLAITGVIMVVFGNQSFALDTKLTQRALYHAERGIEMAYASSTMTSTTTSLFSAMFDGIDDIYNNELKINIASALCFRTVESSVSWKQERRATNTEVLVSKFVDIEESQKVNGDCPTGDLDGWDNPIGVTGVNINGQSNATDIDVQDGFVYITTNPSSGPKHDFFIFEFDYAAEALTPADPVPSMNLSTGLNAVDVGGGYAYVANASSTSTTSSDELIILDISDPDDTKFVSSLSLGITPNCPGVYCPGGAQSIYYYDGRVYVGTHRIGGPEFFIIDVSDPATLDSSDILGSINLEHNINDIMVSGDHAYLASSDDDGEVLAIDISDPSNLDDPDDTGMRFDATGNHDGTAIYVTGDKIFLGRMHESGGNFDDFWILDRGLVTNGDSITDGVLGSKELNLHNDAFVTGIVAIGNTVFLTADDSTNALFVLNIKGLPDIDHMSTCTEDFDFSENNTGLDEESGFVFAANRSNAEIQIFKDQDSCPSN